MNFIIFQFLGFNLAHQKPFNYLSAGTWDSTEQQYGEYYKFSISPYTIDHEISKGCGARDNSPFDQDNLYKNPRVGGQPREKTERYILLNLEDQQYLNKVEDYSKIAPYQNPAVTGKAN